MTQTPSFESNVLPFPVATTAPLTVGEHLLTLQTLADAAGEQGHQSLQDACYLLAEALAEWGAAPSSAEQAEALALLAAWPDLCAAYPLSPQQASDDIIALLRHPGFALALGDDEFADLAAMLLAEAGEVGADATAGDSHADTAPASSPADYLALLAGLGDAAEQDGLQALQDACLLLAEAVAAWADGSADMPDADALSLLDGWPLLCEAYRRDAPMATAGIVHVLRQPSLQLGLDADSLDGLTEMLLGEGTPAAVATAAEAADIHLPAVAICSAQDPQALLHAMPAKVRELVELLLMQIEMVSAYLPQTAEDASGGGLDDAREQLQRFASAAETVGFAGLALAAAQLEANLDALQKTSVDARQLALLQHWIAAVKAYLPAFAETCASQSLLAILSDSGWPLPLSAEHGAELLMQLRQADMGDWQEEPARAQTATAADVSLQLPDDVNRELLDILLQELPGYTQQLSAAVMRLRANGTPQDLDVAQRIAHTLKGSANTVGIKGVAVLTHHMEDILMACAKAGKLPPATLLNALIDASDCLEAMGDALLDIGPPPADAQAVLQTVLDWANRIDREGLPAHDDASPAADTAAAPRAEAAAPAAAEADSDAAAATMVRVSSELIENLFRLAGESILLNSQAQERLRRVKTQINAMQTQFELLRQLGGELDTLIDIKDLSGRSRVGQDFDALEMDQYNELHTASRRMVEAAVDAREMSADAWKELELMDEVLDYQQSLVVETQGATMQTKLVPVSSITPRLQRSLRQTCRLTGKQAELAVSGERLRVDGDTLNNLVDPLMHILRNAVDHGIESEDDRLMLGKPAQGQIGVQFDVEGNMIVVRCRDDGAGLDFGAIRAAAEKRGLLQAGQPVSKEDLQRLILRPNFSTRSESTQTSGRGVGMDAVYAQVQNLGGTVSLQSSEGQGMVVEMRVPLPLSRTHALLSALGSHRVVISSKGLSQVFYAGLGATLEQEDGLKLLMDGVLYPAVRLDTLLHLPERRREQAAHGAILMVQHEDQITAVLLDSIIDSRDVVVKSLGHYIAKIPGIIGATILGDGTVTPVVDIPELLRAPARIARQAVLAPLDAADSGPTAPTVLVVDDSLSNRRALEQLLADSGFTVRTAHDGVEAAELLPRVKPAVVLTDLEMPRMNGIELAAHIRAQASGKTLPIIMITSRTTQRHRKLAEEAGVNFYLTKPVLEDELLGKINDLLALSAQHAA